MRLAQKLTSPSMRWLMLALTIGLVMAVGLSMALGAQDADAKKKKKNSPPSYRSVPCGGAPTCDGTMGSDLIIGSTANEELKGAAGNDIYIGAGGNFDSYTDQSTSSDLYGGFRNDEFGFEVIKDSGGIDTVDPSPYASIDFGFSKEDYDGNGVDDLVIAEEINGANDTLIVLNHFGTGRIEFIKFRDKTLNGASLPLEP